jgi:NADH dehydrogenase FAD-containing subunit
MLFDLQTFGIPSIKEGEDIFFLKQLNHARGIRNNIIDSFEKAAVPTVTEAERRRLLSFVVVGGGPTSCEFVSELHGKLPSTIVMTLSVDIVCDLLQK